MFDVGFWELALIGLIALLVVGPEKLPGLARGVGQWVGRAQRITREFKRDLEREVNMAEVRKLREELKAGQLQQLTQDINREVDGLSRDLNRQVNVDAPNDPKPPASGDAQSAKP
jgi:sec-independent protein translocase protein TatB